MKISPEKFERLLRFLDAEMDPEEISAFEGEVRTDPDLKAQLDFQLNLSGSFSENNADEASVHIEDTKALKSILMTAKNKFSEAADKAQQLLIKIDSNSLRTHYKQVPVVNISRWLAAASIIGLALASSLVYYSGRKNNHDDLAVNNSDSIKKFQPQVNFNDGDTGQKHEVLFPNKMDYASLANESYQKDKGPEDFPQLLAAEINDYDAGNYKTIQAFDVNHIPKTRGDLDELAIKELAYYYKGLSFIETKDNEAARSNLQWVMDSSKDRSLQIKAAWYQAIVALKTSNIQTAALLLNHISTNKTEEIYKQKAIIMIRKIKEGK